MNNNFNNTLNSLNRYIQGEITFKELDDDFFNYFVEPDSGFTEDQAYILEYINEDIGFTVLGELSEEEKIDYIDENELRSRIKENLEKLYKLK